MELRCAPLYSWHSLADVVVWSCTVLVAQTLELGFRLKSRVLTQFSLVTKARFAT